MAQFLSEMKPFELSSSELLMLCNHCPASPVELHLLIEESEERLDEQQVVVQSVALARSQGLHESR